MTAAALAAWQLQTGPDGQPRLCRGGEAFIVSPQTAALFVALKNADQPVDAHALFLEEGLSPQIDQTTFLELSGQLKSALARAPRDVRSPTSLLWEFIEGAAIERWLRPVAAVCSGSVLTFLAIAAVISFAACAPPSTLGWLSRAQEQSGFWLLSAYVVSILVHEGAHAIAALRRGVRLQGAGVGLSFIFPVAFIRFEYRASLPRSDKLIIGMAGIAGQLLLSAALLAVGTTLSAPSFTLAGELTTAMALIQLVPMFNTDGYWLLNDLIEGRAAHAPFALGTTLPEVRGLGIYRRITQWLQIPTLGAAIYASAPDGQSALRWLAQAAHSLSSHEAPEPPDRAVGYGIFVFLILFTLCGRVMLRGIRSLAMGQRRAGGSRQL